MSITKWLSLLFIALVILGVAYEKLGERHDRQVLPQVGQLIDIGGRSINLSCAGSGSPAVILDSGAGGPGYVWTRIQRQLAPVTQVCWFDRAGEGWSDPGPFPRTCEAIARDLHATLQRAHVPPPYVFAGHSFGGLDARVYNGLYPREVAGMVLIDAAHEDEPRLAPKFMLGYTLPRPLWRPLHYVAQAVTRVGLLRLIKGSPNPPANATDADIVAALRQQPKAVAALADYVTNPEDYAEAARAPGMGDKPLIVLTAGRPWAPSGNPQIDREAAAYQQLWIHSIQPKLLRLSTRGKQIVVTNSGHGIPEEAPEAVVDAIREVVMQARAGSQ
jgi:pimeloyl-ACP methyl ester carboxylesterase